MTVPLESQAVQFGVSPSRRQEAYRNSAKIYTQRKDVLRVKSQLWELVPDDDYWTTLSLFVHGKCTKAHFDETMNLYLTTNRARVLHNEFIRSIIFNAHFSTIPPPGVALAAPPLPDQVANQRNRLPLSKLPALSNFSAADLHHLPSIEQLARRVGILLASKEMRMDDTAVQMLAAKINHVKTELSSHRCDW
jgi:hypothetical protein